MDDDNNVYINDRSQFPLFPNLAIELRLKIWTFAFHNRSPQIVGVSTLKHDCNKHEGWCPRYLSSPAPALVNVCHEARQIAYEEAVKTDQIHFVSETTSQGFRSITPPAGIIFDPRKDILYIPSTNPSWSLFTEPFPTGILAQVQSSATLRVTRSLALNLNSRGPRGSERPLRDMGIIRSLEEITFVSKQSMMMNHEKFALAFLKGVSQRRRCRVGMYSDLPDRGVNAKICRFALRTERGVEVMDHLGRFDVPWATVLTVLKCGG